MGVRGSGWGSRWQRWVDKFRWPAGGMPLPFPNPYPGGVLCEGERGGGGMEMKVGKRGVGKRGGLPERRGMAVGIRISGRTPWQPGVADSGGLDSDSGWSHAKLNI